MVARIAHVEKTGGALDPDERSRSAIREKTVRYAEEFLEQLPDMPGYSEGSFEKLQQLKIEEEAKTS